MPLPDKVMDLASAMAAVRPGTRLMMGEFVGAGEPARCVQWLLDAGIGELTLIANTPGMRGGFGKARLFESGQIREYIGTHVGTTAESTEAYLAGRVKLREFFPMGTWAERSAPVPWAWAVCWCRWAWAYSTSRACSPSWSSPNPSSRLTAASTSSRRP